MKVLVACEFSGIVREAFKSRGHDATSVDLLPTEIPGKHIQCDIRNMPFFRKSGCDLEILDQRPEWGYDLLIAFPPCTHLAVSGARWFKDKEKEQSDALEFIRLIMNASIPKIAIENPVGIISTKIRKPDQIIQPWMFGHTETKATCLWLKGLPKLQPTVIVQPLFHSVHREPPSPDRWKNRSRTFKGIAEAMAEQWGTMNLGVK